MTPAEGFPPEPLDPQVKALDDGLPGGLALPVGDDPVKARDQFRRITVALREQLPPGNLAGMEDITVPGATGDQPARVYIPHGDEPAPVILFFHGGGFIVGDIPSYELQTRTIAERAGMRLISAEYRLAPEDPFPAAADDAESIARWALDHAAEFGDGRVIVMGDSAGGNLAAVAAQHVDGILGQVLIYPAIDFSRDYPSLQEHADGPVLTAEAGVIFRDAYVGDADPADPRLSPIHATDFAGQPPAVVVTCEYDILRDAGLAYAAKFVEAGGECDHLHYPTLQHGFMGLMTLSEGCNAALDEICAATRALADQTAQRT